MAFSGGGSDRSSDSMDEGFDAPILSEINITPLTDVFLVLLIIFMVTSSVISQMGVDVNLPGASAQLAQTQPDGVIVTLLPSGEIRVNQARIAAGSWESFEKVLAAEIEKTKSGLVVLEGDQKAFLGSAIEIMDHARKAGAKGFAIATSQGSSAGVSGRH